MTEPGSPDHPNATRVRQLFAAFANRDITTVRDLLAEHAVWHFPGVHGALAGDHRGHDGIFQFLARVMSLTEGTFHLDLHDVIANDETAVALLTGHAQRNGKILHNPTSLHMKLNGGRVTELWEYVWDLTHVEDFWSD